MTSRVAEVGKVQAAGDHCHVRTYALLLHGNNSYANASQYYVYTCIACLVFVMCWAVGEIAPPLFVEGTVSSAVPKVYSANPKGSATSS
jgi:hypothetical protein